jgi:hypothetical protein
MYAGTESGAETAAGEGVYQTVSALPEILDFKV